MSKGDFDIKFKAYRHSKNYKDAGIVHIEMASYPKLAHAMIRFQEYYESPHDHIRGNIFTLGMVRAAGRSNQKPINSYEGGKHFDTDWGGYNFPGSTLDPFIKGLFDPLTEYEQDIVTALKHNDTKNIYVIGTVFQEDDKRAVLDHEICHALWYLNPQYKQDCEAELKKIPTDALENLKKMLLDWGYNDAQLLDECHAYLSADYEWLHEKHEKDLKKFNIEIRDHIHENLRSVKKEHFDEEWLK